MNDRLAFKLDMKKVDSYRGDEGIFESVVSAVEALVKIMYEKEGSLPRDVYVNHKRAVVVGYTEIYFTVSSFNVHVYEVKDVPLSQTVPTNKFHEYLQKRFK